MKRWIAYFLTTMKVCLVVSLWVHMYVSVFGASPIGANLPEAFPTSFAAGEVEPGRAHPGQSRAITPELAEAALQQVWETFDRDYAMFALRPEVDWAKARETCLPAARKCKTGLELATVLAEMLRPLRDLHIWVKVGEEHIPVFNRERVANANPSAYRRLIGELQRAGHQLQWGITADRIGFMAIHGWSEPDLPAQLDATLEEMRGTRGLIVDVRLNGGGSEPLARAFAGRFLDQEYVYSYSQYRNGPKHTDLTVKNPRRVEPRGPWRYDRPVVLLIGQKCMSSNESFIAMMEGAPQVTTLGDHTCGSSGNPKILALAGDLTVSMPRWIDLLADGRPLDEKGIVPKVPFTGTAESFQGERDDLLSAALQRLKDAPLPQAPGPTEPNQTVAGIRLVDGRPPRSATLEDQQEPEPKAARQPPAPVVPPQATPPEVVEFNPPNGAQDVDPGLTELRVTFNVPMGKGYSWTGGGPQFPPGREGKRPYWTEDGKTCVLPVQLRPNWEYRLGLNSPSYKNFRSAAGVPLDPVQYTFKTR